MRGRTRAAFFVSCAGIVATLVIGALAGIAAAVSGGGYNPDQQDCPWNADAWSTPAGTSYTGCHNTALNVESGGTTNGDPNSTNTRYVEFGSNQLPNDPNSQGTPTLESLGYPGNSGSPHAGCVAVNTDGTGGGTGTGCGNNPAGLGFSLTYDYYQLYCPLAAMAGHPCEATDIGTNSFVPDTGGAQSLGTLVTNGTVVYFGMDDNNDNGEHDGVSGVEGPCPTDPTKTCHSAGIVNGPSDGGAIVLSLEPTWLLATGTPTATHPEGLANASEGECADGICAEATTQQQTVYYGCGATNPQNTGQYDQCTPGTAPSGDVFMNNTPASTQEPYNCSSGDATSESCGGTSLDQYRQGTPSQMNAQPGVQTYQDPDPQRSPAAPFGTPGTYVGTCGIWVDDSGGAGAPGLIYFLTGGSQSGPSGQWVVGPTQSGC